jgi:hypothetical protein
MSRHKPPRVQSFSDCINWTDYHWEPNPWRSATAGPRPWTPQAPHARGYSLLQVFLAGFVVLLGLKLMSALKNRALRNRVNRSVLERGAMALMLLLVASYVSRQRRR